jgi:hypothetical protein
LGSPGFSADVNFQKCLFQIQTPQRMKFANQLMKYKEASKTEIQDMNEKDL